MSGAGEVAVSFTSGAGEVTVEFTSEAGMVVKLSATFGAVVVTFPLRFDSVAVVDPPPQPDRIIARMDTETIAKNPVDFMIGKTKMSTKVH